MLSQFPATGRSHEAVFEELAQFKSTDVDWRSGRTNFYVQFGGDDVLRVAKDAAALFFSENAHGLAAFPSVQRLQADVLGWLLDLVQAGPLADGCLTASGSESILFSLKAARDWAKARRPDLVTPKIIVPRSAHPAFEKAGRPTRPRGGARTPAAGLPRRCRGDARADLSAHHRGRGVGPAIRAWSGGSHRGDRRPRRREQSLDACRCLHRRVVRALRKEPQARRSLPSISVSTASVRSRPTSTNTASAPRALPPPCSATPAGVLPMPSPLTTGRSGLTARSVSPARVRRRR